MMTRRPTNIHAGAAGEPAAWSVIPSPEQTGRGDVPCRKGVRQRGLELLARARCTEMAPAGFQGGKRLVTASTYPTPARKAPACRRGS